MNVKSALSLCLFLTGLCRSVCALGPHELLVLANGDTEASVALARRYMARRQVPACNLVVLNIPAGAVDGLGMGLGAFRDYILRPAQDAMLERGIDNHIRAWVYSTAFPTRITTPEQVSLIGATFLRGAVPDAEVVLKAQYTSPLFAGPERTGACRAPQSFGGAARMLGAAMPLPSMMLGFTGERGNSIGEVQRALRRAKESDATQPTGTVYFVENDDVRSSCRAWQFGSARRELARKGVDAIVTNRFPVKIRDVLGVMAGSAVVRPDRIGGFLPGAMAEHLTSYAGAFDLAGQSKMSLWIRAGATLTAGTVVEPRAMYQKFPTARFYVCYASGCTAIESFFLSLRCPLQILPLGDPLAAPWTVTDRVELTGMPDGGVTKAFTVGTRLRRKDTMRFYSYNLWLVDGRVVGRGKQQTIDVATREAGTHRLRVVAYSAGLVRHQVFDEATFEIE